MVLDRISYTEPPPILQRATAFLQSTDFTLTSSYLCLHLSPLCICFTHPHVLAITPPG